MRLSLTWVILLFFRFTNAVGQENEYRQVYPIGEDSEIGYKTSYVKHETILFDACPYVRYSFYNDIRQKLMNDRPKASAYYVSFRPQVRMYTDNSKPVKMPSYRILFGHQRIFRHKDKNLFAFSIESGHYSNGQTGAAFSDMFEDGSLQSDSIYRLIASQTDLSAILNRKDGNFSTNLTEVILNYRFNRLRDLTLPDRIHSLKIGAVMYHDRLLFLFPFGGYSDEDIKIYGRWRFLFSYEYTHPLKNGKRISVADNVELIQGAHKSVNPLRNVLVATFFPFNSMKEFGFFANYIYGHDNYNFRFVDSGHQASFGILWSLFPPFDIKRGDE